jgi:TP901 family phage tail tape measure protein
MTTAAGRVVLTFDIDDKGVVKGLGAIGGKVKDAGEAIRKQGQGLKDWGEGLTKYVTAPLLGVGGAALAVGLDFEKSMNSIQGVLQPTAAQMERIRATAIKMGADTAFSATDAADAMLELGKAGFDTDTAIASVDEVLQLAAASGLSMADSASLAARTLNAFGLEATDLGHVNDVLAKSVNATSLEIGDLQVAFGYVGPIATGFGMSIETVSAALGIMRDNGIAAETTGRALREGFTRLVNPTKDVREVMEELGIETFKTADGGMMSLSDIIGILEEKGINTGQAMKMFGDAAGPGMAALVSKGRGALDALTAQLEKSDGAAKAMADAMMTGLPGALERLKGSVETALLSISRAIEPAAVLVMDKLGGAADIVTNVVVPAFVALPGPVQAAALGFLALAAAAGPTLLIAGQLVIAWGHATTALGVGGLAGAAGLAAKGIGLVAVAFAGWQVGKWIGEMTGLTGAVQNLTERFFDLRNTAEPVESQQRVIAQAIALGADKAVTFAQALQFLKDRAAQLRAEQQPTTVAIAATGAAAAAAVAPVVDLSEAKEAAEKAARALKDQVEEEERALLQMGLTTRDKVLEAVDLLSRAFDRAQLNGVSTTAALRGLIPKLQELQRDARASGLRVDELDQFLAAATAEARALAGEIPTLTHLLRSGLLPATQMITAEQLRATTQTYLLNRAYETLGIESQLSLNKVAQAARDAYAIAAAAGWESAAQEKAARQAVLDAEIAAGQRTISIWQAEILPAIQGVVSTFAGNVSTALTDMLTGQMSFRDGAIAIWESLKQGVTSILDTILGTFINSFLQGMLQGLNGWAAQAGRIFSSVFSMGQAGMSGMLSPGVLTAPGMGGGAAGGLTVGGVAAGAGLGVAAAGAGYTLGKMGYEFVTAAFGEHFISPEAQADLDRAEAIRMAEYTGAAARAGMTPEEFIASGGTPGFIAGGEVFAGAGMDARLHGHEAIFPLPDGFDLAGSLQALEQMYTMGPPDDASAAVPMALPTPEVRVYLGNHEFRDYIVETNLRAYEENRGGGAPVGPTTRARLALGVA